MAVFVELDDEDVELPQDIPKNWPPVNGDALKRNPPMAITTKHVGPNQVNNSARAEVDGAAPESDRNHGDGAVQSTPPAVRENPNRNRMTEALGCYPIIMTIVANIDLITLDSLSLTCRQIREGLLQYRKILLVSTMHCTNEDIPVDPEETLRYRARAGNWFYMEDTTRTSYNGKSGECARDLVSECRRCGTVVCRNCAIKPPAPIVLRDRHRRLCKACTKSPLCVLVKPRLPLATPLYSDSMQRLICNCQTEGVWLCQPCGRTIRSDDYEYRSIWKWRTQYGEVLGGLGTGIGDGDRGVICGRGSECCAAHDQAQETDCDAEDAREAEGLLLGNISCSSASPQPLLPHPWAQPSGANSFSSLSSLQASLNGHGHTPIGTPATLAVEASRRTPSPSLGPGYVRHEIEGIGGVVKTKRLKMVKVGACVNDYEDEKASGQVLGREIKGKARSWCGWCWRVIPGKKDEDAARQPEAKGKMVRSDSESSSSSALSIGTD